MHHIVMYKGTALMIKGAGFDFFFFFLFILFLCPTLLYLWITISEMKLFKTSKLRIKHIGNNKPNSYFLDRIKHTSGQNMPLFLFLTAFRMFKKLVFLDKENLRVSIFSFYHSCCSVQSLHTGGNLAWGFWFVCNISAPLCLTDD